jgi:hypothetical protein
MGIPEGTIRVGAVSVTASELTQAITWLEENIGTRYTFAQGMKNLSNPLASWSASRGYTGLKGHPHSSTIPPKERILSYLRLHLASADTGQGTENAGETRQDTPTPGLGDGKRPIKFERGTIGPTPQPVSWDKLSQLLNDEIGNCLREKFGDRVDSTNAYGDNAPPGEVILGRSELVKNLRVSVSFRDTAGIAWHRTPDGRLVKEGPTSRTDLKSAGSAAGEL